MNRDSANYDSENIKRKPQKLAKSYIRSNSYICAHVYVTLLFLQADIDG